MEIFKILDNEEIINQTKIPMEKKEESEFDDKEDEDDFIETIKNPKIFKERQDKSLIDLKRMIEEDEIILQPEYQRNYVWTNKNAILFIESLFMSIPIPTIFVSENNDNKWELIDGQQRLTTIIRFFNNEITLKHLKIIPQFNNKKFKELESDIQRFFKNVTLQILIIKKETDLKMKYDIFSRLNKGSITLNEQELRNSLFNSAFNRMLKEIAKENNNEFTENMKKRMLDIEVILRFFTMKKLYSNNFHNYKGLTDELTNCMIENELINNKQIEELKKHFNESFNKVNIVFSKNKFRYYDINTKEFNKLINRSVLDIQMCILSKYSVEELSSKRNEIMDEFLKSFEKEEFRNSLKLHTNNIEEIKKRFAVMENLMKKVFEKNET